MSEFAPTPEPKSPANGHFLPNPTPQAPSDPAPTDQLQPNLTDETVKLTPYPATHAKIDAMRSQAYIRTGPDCNTVSNNPQAPAQTIANDKALNAIMASLPNPNADTQPHPTPNPNAPNVPNNALAEYHKAFEQEYTKASGKSAKTVDE